MNRDEMRRLIETHREAEAVGDLDAVLATFADDCFLGIGGIADGLDPLERRLRPQRAFDAVLHEQCLCDLVPQRRVDLDAAGVHTLVVRHARQRRVAVEVRRAWQAVVPDGERLEALDQGTVHVLDRARRRGLAADRVAQADREVEQPVARGVGGRRGERVAGGRQAQSWRASATSRRIIFSASASVRPRSIRNSMRPVSRARWSTQS